MPEPAYTDAEVVVAAPFFGECIRETLHDLSEPHNAQEQMFYVCALAARLFRAGYLAAASEGGTR